MKYSQAVNLAIKAIDNEIKRLNVDANLYEFYGMAKGKGNWEQRKKLKQAVEILKGQQRLDL